MKALNFKFYVEELNIANLNISKINNNKINIINVDFDYKNI